jgi:O-antigen ligase
MVSDATPDHPTDSILSKAQMTSISIKIGNPRFLPREWGFALLSVAISPIILFFPLHTAIALMLVMVITLFCIRPMFAVYLITALYALESCVLEFHFENASYYYGYVWVHSFEIINLIALIAIPLWYLGGYHRHRDFPFGSSDTRWILCLLGTFVVWSALSAALSPKFDVAVFGWWKLNCNFVMMAVLILHLDRYDKFVRVMSLYCGVAFVFALFSIYATHHAFETTRLLYVSPDVSASMKIALFNRPGGVMEKLVGLVNGFGLSGKHQLGMLMIGGILFALFLTRHYTSWMVRGLFIASICLFEMILYNNLMKLSLAASFLLFMFAVLFGLPLRRYRLHIAILFVSLNIIGWAGSKLIQAPHLEATGEILGKAVPRVAASSQYQVGSIAHRVHIWEQTIEKIRENPLTGVGPGGLRRDLAFDLPHGHNFFLTLSAEYGVLAGLLMVSLFFLVGIVSYRHLFSGPSDDSRVRFLKLTLLAVLFSALFESFFDCDVWSPHLWFVLALLLGATNLENRAKHLNAGDAGI